ncbi:MAG: alcohol dehydrogenase catalytic domain-containing protein [Chloroflexi bacterium]|nr:alcohol dehydrogenase catalytic domain-containing protein [Chloroflexota bacterium]
MRAARYHGPGQPLRIESVPVPAAGDHDALVRVRAAGVCHTELHFLSGLLNLGIAPLTLGHEIAGEVAEVGSHVRNVRPGDRVLAYYYQGCGSCRWCLRAEENLCDNLRAEHGFITDGGYAEYVRVAGRNCLKLPDTLGFEEAATLGCSATTAIHSAKSIAGIRQGETAVVYGVGGIGYALVQLCKLSGADVIAVGRSEERLARAKDLGADATVRAAKDDVVAEVMRLTEGRGADVVFELVGVAETMANAVAMLAKRGRLVLIGYSEDPFTASTVLLVIKEAVVMASVGNTLAEMKEALDLAGRGKLKAVLGGTYPLEEANRALDDLKAGRIVGRAVLLP